MGAGMQTTVEDKQSGHVVSAINCYFMCQVRVQDHGRAEHISGVLLNTVVAPLLIRSFPPPNKRRDRAFARLAGWLHVQGASTVRTLLLFANQGLSTFSPDLMHPAPRDWWVWWAVLLHILANFVPRLGPGRINPSPRVRIG